MKIDLVKGDQGIFIHIYSELKSVMAFFCIFGSKFYNFFSNAVFFFNIFLK